MEKLQICTNLLQSKDLKDLVPEESSDMYWGFTDGKQILCVGKCCDPNGIPAWSLSALVSLLPKEIRTPALLRITTSNENFFEGCFKMVKYIYFKKKNSEPVVELI